MNLMIRVQEKLIFAPECPIKYGILYSKAPYLQQVNEVKEMATDNKQLIINLIGQQLTDEILKF